MREATPDLPRTMALLQKGRQDGLHTGAQLYVSFGGESVADLAVGDARPGVPMRPETLTLWFSSGKPITTMAVAQLCEKNRLSLNDRVSKFVPEFATGGKAGITIRHLLTHTGGFRDADKLPDDLPWEEMIARICATPMEPGWTLGEKAGYHLFSSWFILGEFVRRVDGRPVQQYAREMILEPLGMYDSWLGVPAERLATYGDRIGSVFVSTVGKLAPCSQWNNLQAVTAHRPGSNVRGPIRELGRFYEGLVAILSNRVSGPAAIMKPRPSGIWSHVRESACSITRSGTCWTSGLVFSSTQIATGLKPCLTATDATLWRTPLATLALKAPAPSPTRTTNWLSRGCATDFPANCGTRSGRGRLTRPFMRILDWPPRPKPEHGRSSREGERRETIDCRNRVPRSLMPGGRFCV